MMMIHVDEVAGPNAAAAQLESYPLKATKRCGAGHRMCALGVHGNPHADRANQFSINSIFDEVISIREEYAHVPPGKSWYKWNSYVRQIVKLLFGCVGDVG